MVYCVSIFFIFLYLTALALMLAVVFFRAAEWGLNRRRRGLRLLVFLALAVLAAGTAYGLLRFTGALTLPNDNTHSGNFFDTSWRDDGVRLLVIWGGPFLGAAAAWGLDRKKRRASAPSYPSFQNEEKS